MTLTFNQLAAAGTLMQLFLLFPSLRDAHISTSPSCVFLFILHPGDPPPPPPPSSPLFPNFLPPWRLLLLDVPFRGVPLNIRTNVINCFDPFAHNKFPPPSLRPSLATTTSSHLFTLSSFFTSVCLQQPAACTPNVSINSQIKVLYTRRILLAPGKVCSFKKEPDGTKLSDAC